MSPALTRALMRRHPSPEWSLFFEVSDSTGSYASRRADAVAFGIWPSRGLALWGYEVKADRRDWLREMKNPAKAEALARHVDAWWLLTERPGIAKAEELPAPWGLVELHGDQLKTIKPCVPFPDRDHAVMRRSFAAAMLRKVAETMTPTNAMQPLVEERVQQALARLREGHELKYTQVEVQRLRQCIADFQAASGVDITRWEGPTDIGKAVDAVLHARRWRRDTAAAHQQLSRVVNDLQAALDATEPAASVLPLFTETRA